MANVKIVKEGSTVAEVRASPATPLGGMRPDVDAAALERTDFIELRNIRRIGPSIVNRPGQVLFFDLSDPATGGVVGSEPTGLGNFPIGAQRRIVVVADGCPGVSAGAGFSLSSYCLEQSPRFQPIVYRPGATSFCAARFVRSASVNGLLPAVDAVMFAADGILYKLSNVPFIYGSPALPQTNGGQEIPVWTVPTGYTSISCMLQHGSSLIISAKNGAGTSAIFSWDGLTFTRELNAIDEVTGMGLYRDTLIAGHNGGTNLIRVRSAAGVWSTVAPGAGVVKIPANYRCASYRDVFYIPVGDDRLYSFDGTTLTQILAATTGVTAGGVIHGLEVGLRSIANPAGRLYYSWDAAGPSTQRIGAYDGTTWTANHKDILAQFASTTQMRGLRAFSGNLVVAAITTDLRLYVSPRAATSGTYEEVIPANVTNSADVREMLVY